MDAAEILLLRAYTHLVGECRCDECAACALRHDIAEHFARHEAAVAAKEPA